MTWPPRLTVLQPSFLPTSPIPAGSAVSTQEAMQLSWNGVVSSPQDAYILLEACRTNILPKISRRLTDMERLRLIAPGAVFVWDEAEARWTDHLRWSPSRVSGAFLIYSSLEQGGDGAVLFKQSFSSTTRDGLKLHLIVCLLSIRFLYLRQSKAYYDKESLDSGDLPTVASDARLSRISIPIGIYPDHRAIGLSDAPRISSGTSSSSFRSAAPSGMPALPTSSYAMPQISSASLETIASSFATSLPALQEQQQYSIARYLTNDLDRPAPLRRSASFANPASQLRPTRPTASNAELLSSYVNKGSPNNLSQSSFSIAASSDRVLPRKLSLADDLNSFERPLEARSRSEPDMQIGGSLWRTFQRSPEDERQLGQFKINFSR